jgi:formamidopyrimidine-DNA glycosylase
LPEVEVLCRRLDERLSGQRIVRLELASLSALKTFDPPLQALEGSQVRGVHRRGKFVCIDTSEGFLVFNLARSGWVTWREAFGERSPKLGRGPLALRVRMDAGGGFDLTERSTEKRLALYVVAAPAEIKAIATLGPEPLDPAFTEERLGELLAAQKGDLKHALSLQSLIAGIGNAYSDEVLHAARLSPFKPAAKLSPAELHTLYSALVSVLTEAIERASGLGIDELKDGKRSTMAVHGRTGAPCPDCGDTVREVSFATRSLQYCPNCQTGGRLLADRRLSRLVK